MTNFDMKVRVYDPSTGTVYRFSSLGKAAEHFNQGAWNIWNAIQKGSRLNGMYYYRDE